MTEYFQWSEGTFFSTLYGKTHKFRILVDGQPQDQYQEGQPLTELFGTAGLPGTFYLQLRDQYGNLVQDRLPDTAVLNVDLIGVENGQLVYLGTQASPQSPEINYMGFGIYAIRFYSDKASSYTVNIEINGIPVREIVQDELTLEWLPGGSFYQLRIRPSVTDPNMCGAYGPGLRGALVDKTTTITVIARDELGNQRDETGNAQASSRPRRAMLKGRAGLGGGGGGVRRSRGNRVRR